VSPRFVEAMAIKIGTAGWSIPRQVAGEFPAEGSALRRYSARFGVVEINSSFHRPHRHSTWQRWHDSVPAGFRFSVSCPSSSPMSKGLSIAGRQWPSSSIR
jgi:uncharacterized protein YecE (DUF72 family)